MILLYHEPGIFMKNNNHIIAGINLLTPIKNPQYNSSDFMFRIGVLINYIDFNRCTR